MSELPDYPTCLPSLGEACGSCHRCTRPCPTCGLPAVTPEHFRPGVHPYDDTPGGHADRHTLVVEAAERTAHDTDPRRAGGAEA